MGFVDGGPLPRVGSVVNLPNGRQGTVEKVFSIPFFSWFNQTLYYSVRWNDDDRRVRTYSFDDLEVVGQERESIY